MTHPAHIESALRLIQSYAAFEADGATFVIAPSGHVAIPADAARIIDGDTFTHASVAQCPEEILELYADRCADLDREYGARVAADEQADAWRIVSAFADHNKECVRLSPEFAKRNSNGDGCTCGYSLATQRAVQADYDAAKPPTAYARLVALGRAALLYADGTITQAQYEERLRESRS